MPRPDIGFRNATEADLATIVALLADDPLGVSRENPDGSGRESYVAAFRAIDADPNHEILVADLAGAVIGVLQLSFIPHLTYEGGWRAQIEGVRVDAEHRARGVGRALFEVAIARARTRGCHLVQLTTDRARPGALAFYEALGFKPTHDGLKLHFGRRADPDEPPAQGSSPRLSSGESPS